MDFSLHYKSIKTHFETIILEKTILCCFKSEAFITRKTILKVAWPFPSVEQVPGIK